MFLFHKRPKMFSARDRKGQIWERRRAALSGVFLFFEPLLCFYGAGGLLIFIAVYLIPETANIRLVQAAVAVSSLMLTAFIIFTGIRAKRAGQEQAYIEHLVYLFCKNKSFVKALREMQGFFPKGEVRKAVNQAVIMLGRGGDIKKTMEIIERRLTGRNVRLVHRYILESEKKRDPSPPAEILTGLVRGEGKGGRRVQQVRFDRLRLLFCSSVSFTLCFAIRCLAEDHGLVSRSVSSGLLMAVVLCILEMIFLCFEIREAGGHSSGRQNKKQVVCSYLRELAFLLLVMPVSRAIAASVAYSDKRVRRSVSKLAEEIEKKGASSIPFLRFASELSEERVTRIMEFLYAKIDAASLTPSELTPMIRLLDELEAGEEAALSLEVKRRRLNLLLAPQAAALVMVLGNFMTLIDEIGREI